MKQLTAVSANFIAAISEEDGLLPAVELVLLWTEPEYAYDSDGEIAKGRKIGANRFTVSAGYLRELADQLKKFADDVEASLESAIDNEIAFENDLAEAAGLDEPEPDDSDTSAPVPPVVAEASC